MILIKPDKSFEGALPERYGQEGKTFEEVFADANISKTGGVSNAKLLKQNNSFAQFQMCSSGISFTAPNDGIHNIKVYSIDGRIVKAINVETTAGVMSTVISKGELSSGAYIFETMQTGNIQRTLLRL